MEKKNLIIVMGPTGSGKGYTMKKYIPGIDPGSYSKSTVECLIDNFVEKDQHFKNLNKIVLDKMKESFDTDKLFKYNLRIKNILDLNFDEEEIIKAFNNQNFRNYCLILELIYNLIRFYPKSKIKNQILTNKIEKKFSKIKSTDKMIKFLEGLISKNKNVSSETNYNSDNNDLLRKSLGVPTTEPQSLKPEKVLQLQFPEEGRKKNIILETQGLSSLKWLFDEIIREKYFALIKKAFDIHLVVMFIGKEIGEELPINFFKTDVFPEDDYFNQSAKIGIESNLKRFFTKLLVNDDSARLPVLFDSISITYNTANYYLIYRKKLIQIYKNAFVSLKSCFKGKIIEKNKENALRLFNNSDPSKFDCKEKKYLDYITIIQTALNTRPLYYLSFVKSSKKGQQLRLFMRKNKSKRSKRKKRKVKKTRKKKKSKL
tara:strand:- start:176 stop:1462 length:1287 start_codon:yes stop_codon:yes gene_type:complete